MHNPVTAATTNPDTRMPPLALTAHGEDAPAGLFTVPVDLALLEQLEVDELGRRSRWLPDDLLL